jgi:hypothetical protein
MSTDPPIACSLSATELTERRALLRELGRTALLDARTRGTRAVLRFTPGAGVRDRVDAIVAAESACCPFLAMRVGAEPAAVVLTIDAPAGAEPVLEELVGGFRAAARPDAER